MTDMFRYRMVTIGLFLFMLLSLVQSSEAELWDLIVDADIEEVIDSGDIIIVTGSVMDHAYDPVVGVDVLIRTGMNTTSVVTDELGRYRGEFQSLGRAPAMYMINIVASLDEMRGWTSVQFQIKGDPADVSALEVKLSTEEAKRYLAAEEGDFEKDPIGHTLFKYYQRLSEELVEEEKKNQPTDAQLLVEQQRRDAEEARRLAIKLFASGSGTYDGYQYDRYIRSLSPEIRDMITGQLNFTKDMFEKAQEARDKILADGGTHEEARQAYLDIISIPKEDLEKYNDDKMDKDAKQPDKVKKQ